MLVATVAVARIPHVVVTDVQLVRVSVYTCSVMATPTHAFVPDVFPGLASPERRIVSIDFVRLRISGVGNTDAIFHPR